MRVYKFGGASVKDAAGVRNLLRVLVQLKASEVVVVISAMGKMTNAFEEVLSACFGDRKRTPNAPRDNNEGSQIDELLQAIKEYHFGIIDDLGFANSHPVRKLVTAIFDNLEGFLKTNQSDDYDYVYDWSSAAVR